MKGIIDIIKSYEVKGSKFGLSRTRNLLNALGSPDDALKIIHVAGTNGKGSICSYLTRIAVCDGKRVGTFTSPEVYSYNEKFAINGEPASDGLIEKYLEKAYSLSLKFDDKPTAFEIETAAALAMFVGEGCEYAVIECGMGGLNDSTNAINKKVVCAIGSISLEHTAILGDTITEICRQKAGIIKDCPAVVNCLQTEEGLNYFKRLGVKFAGEGLKIIKHDLCNQTFTYNNEEYTIKMLGLAQAYNAAVAVECAKIAGFGGSAIKRGLAETKLCGRVEIIKKSGRVYILDGSHNPASFSPLCGIVDEADEHKSLVFACLSDKDVDAAAFELARRFDNIFVFSPTSYRAMSGDKIYNAFAKRGGNVTLCANEEEALNKADMPTVVVCGTFTILKEARQWIEKRQ
jgi:dihydrofolate synthase/folylpolyglutamate synthase